MERIDFTATDGINLNGLLYKTENKSEKNVKTVILAVHGMSSNCFKTRDTVIAQKANDSKIDYFCFNNRGSDLVRYIRKTEDGKKKKFLGGTSYEDVLDGYKDILGAIKKLKEIGYSNIYLQGHSLGSTKIVYTYNKLKEENNIYLKDIKGIILLSLVDIPMTLKIYLRDNFKTYVSLAEEKQKEGKDEELMPRSAFIHPVSVKTFLRYAKYNEEINFAQYGKDNKLEKLNNIDVPLFMRWGNDNEMILQKADELVKMIDQIIKNPNKNIDYIDGADHGYSGKEEILAKQIIEFCAKGDGL